MPNASAVVSAPGHDNIWVDLEAPILVAISIKAKNDPLNLFRRAQPLGHRLDGNVLRKQIDTADSTRALRDPATTLQKAHRTWSAAMRQPPTQTDGRQKNQQCWK